LILLLCTWNALNRSDIKLCLQITAILLPVPLAAVIQSRKYRQPFWESLLLLTACLAMGIIPAAFLYPIAYEYLRGSGTGVSLNQVFDLTLICYLVGCLSGPMLWNHWVDFGSKSRIWLRALGRPADREVD
jgi:hypothetical protein